MKSNWFVRFALCAGFLAVCGPALAHHGSAAYSEKLLEIKQATVTKFMWASPHCLINFDAKDDKGNVVHWVAETSNPSDMTDKGWSRHTFKPGDEVTVRMIAAKNGHPVGRIQYVILNGQGLGADKAPPSATTNATNDSKP